jgi:hypothetical protein
MKLCRIFMIFVNKPGLLFFPRQEAALAGSGLDKTDKVLDTVLRLSLLIDYTCLSPDLSDGGNEFK